jgi:ABC-type glycerol-3-phosphate transport system substrate-binding protein
MTRRAALGTMAAVGAGFALLGPRSSGTLLASRGRIVLDYWEKWTGHEGEAMRRIVDEFNASQDRIFVRYFAMAGIDQKALIAIAGNSPPDILGVWNFSIPAFADSGAIVPLDELAAESGISRQQYALSVWPMLTHRGRLYAMVSTCGSLAMYYNRQMFRAAGLDPDRPPTTIAELDDAATRMTLEESPGGRLTQAGFLQTEPDWWTWHWGYFFGGSLYDEASGRALAAAPANVRAYEWVQSYPQRWGADRLVKLQSGFGWYGTAEHPFLTGRIAMTMQGPWLANLIQKFAPDLDFGVVPFPVEASLYNPAEPIGLLDSDVLVVPRGAKHPRESFEFIAYVQRPEIMERLSAAHCKNSPLRNSSDRFVAEHPNRFLHVHDAIANSPRAFLFPRTRIWSEYVAQFDAAMQGMWRLQAPASAALAGVERAVQARLDREAQMRAIRQGAAL